MISFLDCNRMILCSLNARVARSLPPPNIKYARSKHSVEMFKIKGKGLLRILEFGKFGGDLVSVAILPLNLNPLNLNKFTSNHPAPKKAKHEALNSELST